MHKLPALPYEYTALEPYIDGETMRLHHEKHHQGYVDKLNKTLSKFPELEKLGLVEILKDLSSVPEEVRFSVKNNGGGHFNHSFFWRILCSPSESKLTDDLEQVFIGSFGSFEKFKEQFKAVAVSRFGSGWIWLLKRSDDKLTLTSTANQDIPFSEGEPILGLDVWEHAYYLKYQNRRAEYAESFFSVINWKEVEKLWRI